jgi:hypothetical protein
LSKSQSMVFSMPVVPASIRSLRQALSSICVTEAPLQQQWWEDAGFAPIACSDGFSFDDDTELASASTNQTERIWFKVVFKRPSKAKRAQAGKLITPDLGLSLHRPLMRNNVSQRVVVDSDPIRLQHQTSVSEYGNVPLILSPQSMDLTSLLGIECWRVEPTLWYRMNMQADPCLPVEPDNCYMHINDTVKGLSTSGCFIVSPNNASHDDVQILLQHYQEHGLVKSEVGTWSLTSEGRKRITVGNVLCDRANVLQPRDVQYKEMQVFELMASLEFKGWTCAVACPKLKKIVRKSPFVRGKSPLTWYVDQSGHPPCKEYLVALLSSVPGASVPHFADTRVYADLTDMPVKASKKRRRMLVQGQVDDDFEALDDIPIKKPRATRRLKAINDVIDPGKLLKPILDISSESEAQSSRSHRSGSGDASGSHESQSGDARPATSLKALGKRGANTSVGSKAQRQSGSRNLHVGCPFGLCRLTPRPDASGYQMSCTHPDHENCNKSLSNKVSGGEQQTLQMLKYWAVLGIDAKSKVAHKDMWEKVCDAAKSGELLAMEELDKQAPMDWVSVVADAGHAADVLGGPHKGVPLDVHQRMLDLHAAGAIGLSNPSARLRNKSNSRYRVDPALEEALRYSYLHPNLPNPPGYVWQGKNGWFRLMPLGG